MGATSSATIGSFSRRLTERVLIYSTNEDGSHSPRRSSTATSPVHCRPKLQTRPEGDPETKGAASAGLSTAVQEDHFQHQHVSQTLVCDTREPRPGQSKGSQVAGR